MSTFCICNTCKAVYPLNVVHACPMMPVQPIIYNQHDSGGTIRPTVTDQKLDKIISLLEQILTYTQYR